MEQGREYILSMIKRETRRSMVKVLLTLPHMLCNSIALTFTSLYFVDFCTCLFALPHLLKHVSQTLVWIHPFVSTIVTLMLML